MCRADIINGSHVDPSSYQARRKGLDQIEQTHRNRTTIKRSPKLSFHLTTQSSFYTTVFITTRTYTSWFNQSTTSPSSRSSYVPNHLRMCFSGITYFCAFACFRSTVTRSLSLTSGLNGVVLARSLAPFSRSSLSSSPLSPSPR